MIKAIIFVATLSVFLGGCAVQQSVDSRDNDMSALSGEEEKKGDITKTGTVVKTANAYFLVETNGNKVELDSYKYQLSEYEGKVVTVTGQYSGDTLFVGNLQ